jgi:4'-phosphopantetheinyl transferase
MADRWQLQPDSSHIWWARSTDAVESLVELLSDDERQRLAALRRPVDRDRFVVGCGLARLALAGYMGCSPSEISISRTCQRCGKPHGKPRLAPSASSGDLEFSVSHAGDRVVVAFARGRPLGVDVEEMQPDLCVEKLAPLILAPCEVEVLEGLDAGERILAFFIYWTRKEAVIKATGRGLDIPLQSFSVSGPYEPPRLTAWPEGPEHASRMSLHDLDPGAGYVASLAIVGHCCRGVLDRDGSALIARWSTRR